MRDESKLNELAAEEIASLRRDGIEPTPAEIVLLSYLGWQVETPETRQHLSRGCPVEVSGVYLWPLTLWAADWLERVASKFPDSLSLKALAYAMAHAYSDGGELDKCGSDSEASVRAWGRSLRCTPAQLVSAVELVQGQDEESEQPTVDSDAIAEHAGMTRGDYSAFLAAATGQSPEFWERRCSQSYTFAVLQQIIRQKMAESGSPIRDDAKIKAEIALGWAVEKIRRRHAEASSKIAMENNDG